VKILVTGANGFIGKNLVLHLREIFGAEVLTFLRGQDDSVLRGILSNADAVVHLAGENRPSDERAFSDVNVGLTQKLCEALVELGKDIPVLFSSSTQADEDNAYGSSKLAAENALENLAQVNGNPVAIYRLPGVFGKWCKPNYNSVVATFCYQIGRDLPAKVNDPSTLLRLVYVDDVVNAFVQVLKNPIKGLSRPIISPEFRVTLEELFNQIEAFKNCRSSLMSERVGAGFIRALYATYLSYLPVEKFAYALPTYKDSRGVFVEMLKTPDTGQFSFFTAHPGVTRGGHYHHTKTEKFVVVKGSARFGFRHMSTNDVKFIDAHGESPQIVETIPGWAHDITNIGDCELIVMLWANEIFDRSTPDTFTSKV
jgi:UDP-2-acetamido-2,6-beta-L-arabino-hexul-4-ose reductase